MENRSCQTNLTTFFLLLAFFFFKSRITSFPGEAVGFVEDMENSNGLPRCLVMFSYKNRKTQTTMWGGFSLERPKVSAWRGPLKRPKLALLKSKVLILLIALLRPR